MQEEKTLAVLPARPRGSYDRNFRQVDVMSNHFFVGLNSDFEKIYIFSLRISPQITRDNRSLKLSVIRKALTEIEKQISNPAVCGMNIMTNKPPKNEEFEVQCGEYKISLKQVKVIEAKNNTQVLLHFFNNRLRNIMSDEGYCEIGRSGKYFNRKYRKDLGELIMYSGFKTNFVQLQKGIFLRADSAKKIVRNQTVLEKIDQLYRRNNGKDIVEKRNLVASALIGETVQANYGNGRYYRIEDIVYQDLEQTILEGEKINIIEYYKKAYNIELRKHKQPLLKAENKKGKFDILIIPELCLMTGIPEEFDEFKRKKVSENTILDSHTKVREINQLMETFDRNGGFRELRKLGIDVQSRMHEFSAKQIPVPRISLGENNAVQQGKEAFFQLYDKPIFNAKHSIRCALIYFGRTDTRDLERTFENTCRNLKVNLKLERIEAKDDRRAVESIGTAVDKAIERDCNICLIVIPGHMQSQYKRIKEVCLVEKKMVCQIAREPTLRKKGAQSIHTKILLQIIAKKGNTLWVPETKNKLEDVMIVGLDTAKAQGGNVLSVVGSVNSTFTSFKSKFSFYDDPNDKYGQMASSLLSVISYYVDRNKRTPKEIIVLSNSCTGDQIKLYQEFFVEKFLSECESAYKEQVPQLSLVMINTKVSDRFFSTRGENVRAGTLISSGVVSKDYDFFLVSQNSNKGCIVPNHYKVIYSSSKLEEGVLQELMFAQCFNYVNWAGSIKVPSVLQYAKKQAKFISEHMGKVVISESMERYPFYI